MPTIRMSHADAAKLLSNPNVTVGPSVRLPCEVCGGKGKTPTGTFTPYDSGWEPCAACSGPKNPAKLKKGEMVRESISVSDGVLTIVCSVEATNEANMRSWRARNRRMGAAWRSVRSAVAQRLDLLHPFARHVTAGGTLKVKFVRMGGRRVDNLAGLGPSVKGVEDAIAYLLGIDDGDGRWQATAEQESSSEVGVRIEVAMA